ncbi:uncharacterized protein LOC111596557 [Drosophila hydei]|uniref:Uncharacterized protein LOC111596557 n=1 Tax=Drosophila hydei TaxID=7224 RepID=A0A6J1LNX9_DROHY|nr:uncharacterized protein LOC111596557 [Drosophila hydei]
MLSFVIFFVALELFGCGLAQVPSRYYLPPAAGESPTTPAPIITKQFYTVSAAEDSDELQPRTKHLVIGRATQNYRVIFIRAPSAHNEAVRYTAELAPQEERTVIYVLSRKQPELESQDIQTPQQQLQSSAKPDVFFIRYKTNEEAAAAQREIQTQYDKLGGNSEHAAPYVAPVQSVIGASEPAMPQADSANEGQLGYDYRRPTTRFH